MTQIELDEFLDKNQHIEHVLDERFIGFRNTNLPWYQNDQNRCTRITKDLIFSEKMTQERLLCEINSGLELEHITRVTGYMSKVSLWNKGKIAELHDRYRHEL